MNSLQDKADAFKKYEFKKFCHILGFKQAEINTLLEAIDNNYKEWSEKKIDKNTNTVKTYKDGTEKVRTFRNPSKFLKIVQTRIKNNILTDIKLPKVIHGGVKKKSNITNAKPHQGNKYIFTTDLQEFYPNINRIKVRETFIRLKFSRPISNWLTQLSTFKDELPQGAPTSTHISNLVFLETDIKIINLCDKNDITYTRYVDDLTFSSPKDFSHLISKILEIITSNDFKLSHRKTSYNGNQTVTGIKVSLNKIDGPKKIIKKSKIEMDTNSDKKPNTIYLNNIRKTNKTKK